MTRHALRIEYGLFAVLLGALLIGQMPAVARAQIIDLQVDPVEQAFENRLDGLSVPREAVADPAASGMMREGIKVDVENPARALFRALKQSAGKSRRDFLGIYMADLNTGEVVPVVDSRARVARVFPVVADRLFPEAGAAVPRMPLDGCGFQGSVFDVSIYTGGVARGRQLLSHRVVMSGGHPGE